MANTLDRIRRQIANGSLQTVDTGAASTSRRSNVARLEEEARRNNRFNQYADRALNDEVFTQEEIDDMRQSRSRTVQRQEQQDYYRRQAEAALAEFERNERARQWDAELGERHGFAADRDGEQYDRQLREAMRTARREAYSDPEYRAYNREVWKDTQRPLSDVRYYDQQISAAQRQRDRVTSGNSYWGRDIAAQEKAMSDNMRRPVDPLNPSQEDLDAAAQYKAAYERFGDRYQNTLDRLDSEEDQAKRRMETFAKPQMQASQYQIQYRGTSNPTAAAKELEKSWDPHALRVNNGTNLFTQAVYDRVTGNQAAHDDVLAEIDRTVNLMTDEEMSTALNLAAAGKWDDVQKYQESIKPVLDARWYDSQMQRIDSMSRPMQAVYGFGAGVANALAGVQTLADSARGLVTGEKAYTDTKSGAAGLSQLMGYARQKSLENNGPELPIVGNVGQFVGQAVYSTLDNLMFSGLGPIGTLAAMSLSAGGNTMVQSIEQGTSQEKAILSGLADAAIEAGTEAIPTARFFEVLNKSGSRGLKNFFKSLIYVSFPEGKEEVIGEFASAAADYVINGRQSELMTAIQNYKDNGETDANATKKALWDLAKDAIASGLSGILSGAMSGGAAETVAQIDTARADLASGRDITDNRRIADVVLDEGMKSTDQRIRDMAYNLDAIRKTNERTENFQWSAADQRRIGEIFDSLDTDARRRVLEAGKYREAQRQAAESKEIKAREAVLQAEQDEKARSEAQQRLDELEAETDRMMEDAETVDLDSMEAEEAADTTSRRGSDEYTDRVETAEDVDADLRRRAAAAEEATRTGDRSALDNLDQPRRTTESTAQTNRQTAQQEPVNPTQQRRDMKKQVRDVYSSMGITSEVSVGEIADAMQDAYNTIAKEGSNTEAAKTATNALLQVAQEHFEEDMLRQAEEDRDRQFGTEDEVYTQARKTIRGTRLYVPQSLNASELGVDSFNEFRRANFGVLNLTRDSQAMPIDTFYDELAREYPGLFPAPDTDGGPTSEADMLRTIADVYRSRGNTMQAEPIDADAIRREAQQKAFGVLSNAVVQAQQAYNNAQNAARESADQIAQKTAENARKAGLSNEETLVMSNVARDLGVNLQFQKMKYDIVNGFYDRKSNTIVLNQNLSTAEKAWTTFAHEITHAAETAGSYNQLRDVAKQYGMKGTTDEAWRLAVDEQRRDYLKAGVKLSKDEAEFELVANTIQKILGSREAMEGVVQYSREDAQALLSSVDNIIDRVTTNSTAITPESARLVQAQKALAAALGEAREQNRYGADNAAQGQKVQYSLDTETDRKYMDAVESGNMDEAQRMVDEAAKRAGYTIKAYHGTKSDSFTVFDSDRTGQNYQGYNASGGGFDFTNTEAWAKRWGSKGIGEGKVRVIPAYLKTGKTFYAYNGEVDPELSTLLPDSMSAKKRKEALSGGYAFKKALEERGINFKEAIQSYGYDSYANYPGDDNIAVYTPEQIKSADPVVYDDNGNVIPLSERFNADNPDIRYSVEGVDVDDIYRRALEKYGKMRSGEQLMDEQGNPVTRETTLPKQTSDNTKTRGLYRTADEANSVQINVREKAIMDQYKPTSNQENVAKANEMRSKFKGENSFDKAYGAWQDMVDKGLSSRYSVLSNQIAFAETLFMEAQREGRIQEAYTILSDLAQFGTTAGQAVQALSLIKRLSPEGQLMHYNRVVENFANSGKKGKTPANVQTVMTTQEDIDKLLNSMTELRKLKRFEANGGKMTEAVARRIAELEKEIEALHTKLAPQLEKYNRLVQEKNATTLERNKLKREEKTLPKNIKDTEERIKNLRAEIDDLNNELEPKRMELQAKLADEDLAKEERNKAKKELDAVNRKIKAAQKRINNLRAEIQTYFDEMPLRTMKLHEMLLYERYLASAKEVMDIYLRYTKNKGGNVKVPENLQVEYLDAKTEEEREAVRKKMDIAIADQLPGTWSEKIRGWRYISMLFNPTTHLRNMAGNTVQYGLKGMRDTIATGLERAFIRGDGERTKAIMNRFSKADKAYFNAAQEDYKIIEADLQAGGKASETQGIENARKIYGNKYAEAVRRFSGDLLEKEDKIFLRANYTQSFAEYLKANKIDPTNMTDAQKERARQIAFQQALEATYRDASTIASALSNLEKQGAGWEFALGGIMPFKKTPVNVLKRGVEYSPAGIIKATYDMIQATRGKNAKTKSDIIGEYAAGLTGSMVAALGLLAAKAGIALASPGDDDKDRKKAMDEATGQQDYAIKFNIGGKEWTYTFDWVAPASMAFFAGVRAYEAWHGKEDFSLQAALDGLISTINPVFELSMLDGLAGMFKSYASDEAGTAAAVAWSILESYALQFFPTVGGKLARAIDPYQRSTYSPKDSPYTKNLERLYRRAMAKIPGASYSLEPVIDQYGNPKENIGKNLIGRLGYNLTSPGYIKEVTHNLTDEELKRLYKDLGKEKTDMLYKETPTYYELDGEKYYLDAHEYARVSEKLGKESATRLDTLLASDKYKNANDTMKAKMVASELDDAAEEAKRLFYEDIGVLDEYLRTKIEPLLYDNSSGETEVRNLAEVRDIYEQGRLDLKTVEAAAAEISHTPKTGAKIDTLNSLLQKYNLTQDEYDFLYMTKIADQYMQDDMQAVLDAGGTLDQAINTVARFYRYDTNAVDPKTGEAGMWVKYDKGVQAAYLSESKLSAPAKEAFYLNNIVSTNNVEKEQAKIADYYKRNLSFDDYLRSLGTKYDDEGTAYENNAGFYRELYVSDLSAAVKEAAVYNLARYGGDGADKAQADIDAYKKSGLTVQDYILTKASLYDDNDKAYTKTSDKANGLLKSGLSDKALKVAWYTVASDAQGAEDEINAFMKGGNTVKQFLKAKAATSAEGMKSADKANAILNLDLKSFTSAITSIVTTSENKAEGIAAALNAGIRDRDVATAYAKYAEINAREDLNGTGKANEFSMWLDRDSTMSRLSAEQKAIMKDSFRYYNMVAADAGKYDSLMKVSGMSSKTAESISKDLSALEPLPGAKSVSESQRRRAIAYNTTASEKEIDAAMYLQLDSTDDGKEATNLTNYKKAREAGLSAKQYVDYSEKLATFTSDRDANGKEIAGRKKQDKIVSYISSLPITRAQKNALWFLAGYKESTLKKQPWY